MASQSTEHSFITPRQEPQTLRDALSRHVGSEGTPFPQDSCGLHPSTTRCPLTVDTSGRLLFPRFATICARCSQILEQRAAKQCVPLAGFCVGATAWIGYLAAIPISLFIFLLLGRLEARTSVLVLMVGYYAGATWQVFPAAATFFGHHVSPFEVILLWAGWSLVLGLPWAAFWSRKRERRLYTVPILLALLAAPPLGLIGVASPLTTSGVLFPGLGWFGLVLTLFICGLLASYPVAGVALATFCSVPAQLVYHEPQPPSDWQAVTTHFGGVGLDTPSPLAEYTAAQWIQQTALGSPAHVIVFPETVVSNWNEATDTFWDGTFELLKGQGKTILVGANVSDASSPHYFNSLLIRGATQQSDFLQRIPIPMAMWTPGSDRGVPLRLNGAGTLRVAGQNGAILICYEQLLIWPVLTSFKEHPSVLIGVANDYWARHTTVPEIQHACLTSWARLFHLPMLWAENT